MVILSPYFYGPSHQQLAFLGVACWALLLIAKSFLDFFNGWWFNFNSFSNSVIVLEPDEENVDQSVFNLCSSDLRLNLRQLLLNSLNLAFANTRILCMF